MTKVSFCGKMVKSIRFDHFHFCGYGGIEIPQLNIQFADMAELAALNTSAAGGRCNECEKVQRSKSFRFRVPQTVSRRVLPMTPYEIN